jgi:hypothetical protein
MSLLLWITVVLSAPPEPVVLERVGTLVHPAIREASGLVQSRRHPGVFWVHNDSGNAPFLFAVRRDGSLIRQYRLNVVNIDWEDIAIDDQGRLYLGDIGNNDLRLPLRLILEIEEPDPEKNEDTPPKVVTASYYRFPESGRFDAEGLVVEGDTALIVAKTFDGRDAEVYSVPLRPPAPLLRPAVAKLEGKLPGFTEPVTGASLSARGGRLAVCSNGALGVFRKADDGGWLPLAIRTFRCDDEIEAVAWEGDDLILSGEKRGVFRVRSEMWGRPEAGKPYGAAVR